MDRFAKVTILILALALFAGCGGDKPSQPGTPESTRLAGGGRENDSDPFVGGPGVSGPVDSLPGNPGFDIGIQYFPVFYAQYSCPQQPQYRVIVDQGNWSEWWDGAVDCSDGSFGRSIIPIPDSSISDSGTVGPDSLGWGEAPVIDFQTHRVLIIRLEQGTSGRHIWIRSLAFREEETSVNYEVSAPASDCFGPLVDPNIFTTPVAAFIVPRSGRLTFNWLRTDLTYSCSWVPDPLRPLTLYYTDAVCPALGSRELLIRSAEEFHSWVDAAWECDISRWGTPLDTVWGTDSVVVGSDPHPDFDNLVDFTTHAVLILRADPQSAWGGGIWLDRFEAGAGGTIVQYTVMVPGDECPKLENGAVVQPTVAIRIPLPVTEPLLITRINETISCGWVNDSTRVGP